MDFGTAISACPQQPLHRVLSPLCWDNDRTGMKRADGEVRSVSIDGQRLLKLLPQPRRGRVAGVSLFMPLPALSQAVHTYLGFESVGCVTQPGTPLPADLQLFNDIPEVALPLHGQHQTKVPCMSHWVLYTQREMLTSEFEAGYAEFAATCQQCRPAQRMQAAADIWDHFDMDDPADPLTSIAVEALDILANSAANPSHQLCARVFSLHLRSADLPFKAVLQHWSICNLVAGGLGAMTVSDPWLWSDVLDMCELLSEVLDEDVPRPVYKPYWVQAHAFQFRAGQYSSELYDEQVKLFAPGYAHDAVLRDLVRTEATKAFEQLKASRQMAESKETEFEYCGVPMCVVCSCAPEQE